MNKELIKRWNKYHKAYLDGDNNFDELFLIAEQSITALSIMLPEDVEKKIKWMREEAIGFRSMEQTPNNKALAQKFDEAADMLERQQQRIAKLESPVLPKELEGVVDGLRSQYMNPAADMIEQLWRDKVMRDEAYQALCEEGLEQEQRIAELDRCLTSSRINTDFFKEKAERLDAVLGMANEVLTEMINKERINGFTEQIVDEFEQRLKARMKV